jgi:hypothetical protein
MEAFGVTQRKVSPLGSSVEERGQFEVTDETKISFFLESQSNLSPRGFLSNRLLRLPSQRRALGCGELPEGDFFPVTHAASATRFSLAGRTHLSSQSILILFPEKLGRYSGLHKGPGQIVFKASSSGVPIHFNSHLLKSLFPKPVAKQVAPAIESATETMGFYEDTGKIPSSCRKNTLQITEMRILPFEVKVIFPGLILEEPKFFLHVLQWDLSFPLKRRVGLRNEGRDTHIHRGVNLLLFVEHRESLGEFDDAS